MLYNMYTVKTMCEVWKILVCFKKRKEKKKVLPRFRSSGSKSWLTAVCPWRSFTYLPLSGLAGMIPTKLIRLGQYAECETFWKYKGFPPSNKVWPPYSWDSWTFIEFWHTNQQGKRKWEPLSLKLPWVLESHFVEPSGSDLQRSAWE